MSDMLGKFKIFAAGSALSIVMVAVFTNLGPTSLSLAILLNIVLFAGITSRMISSSALITAVPEPRDRGAFMSINSAAQQISGGIASFIAGLIVFQDPGNPDAPLEHYDRLGYVVITSMLIATALMFIVDRMVRKKLHAPINKPI
jgi:MFS family permease